MASLKRGDCSHEDVAMTFKVATAKFVETAKRDVGKVG